LTWYLRSRAVAALIAATVWSLAAGLLPFAELRATPSPAGATLALAILVALTMPIVIGWALSRGDQRAESISPRPIWLLDVLTAVGLGLTVVLGTIALRVAGVSPVGGIASRALLTYLGVTFMVQPFAGWQRASLAPVVLFIVVVIAGRGPDIDHPAAWAWIAALEDDAAAWAFAMLAFAVGLALLLTKRRTVPTAEEE
jgi:hypothetical protein